MPFVDAITKLRSLSIVGMAKNTGKTETLNYLLGRLASYPQLSLALTSIGIDGEKRDQVTRTDKPEIILRPGTIFVTAEKFYRMKLLPAEVCDIDARFTTPIGRAIYARSRGTGKVLIAGPSSTLGLKMVVDKMLERGIDLTIIDGALSRMSLASPSLAEGIILATGAAYSAQPEQLVRSTKALFRQINFPALRHRKIADKLADVDQEIYLIDRSGELFPTGIGSALMDETWEKLAKTVEAEAIFIPGVVTDKILERLKAKDIPSLLVKDFTRIFASPAAVASYLATGKKINVLFSTKLMAVTFNPLAPNGFRLDSDRLCDMLSEALGVPVYDVRRIAV